MPGDVVGIPNHGTLRIGDTLTEGEDLNFVGVPNFAPEILRRVRLPDAMKAKKLKQALEELSEEGVAQVFRPTDGSALLVGVVGPLQLDVLKARLSAEYGLEIDWSTPEFQFARWIAAADRKMIDQFAASYASAIAEDFDGDLVFLARTAFDLEYTGEHNARYYLFRRERHSPAQIKLLNHHDRLSVLEPATDIGRGSKKVKVLCPFSQIADNYLN